MARRWWAVGVAVALAALLAPARPAAADAARPGNVESTITSVPAGAPFHARVRGGDSFLELQVDRGHEVIVADYEGFPYVRYAADGVVSENQQSKASFQNKTRAASSEGPQALNPGGPPEWKQVATGGVYAWHDHRIHWMSPTRAPEQAWEVDLTVDGQPMKMAGRYGPVDAPSALPWWLVVLVVAGAVGWFARRRHAVGAAAVLVGAVVAVPVVVSLVRLPQSSWLLGALIVARGGRHRRAGCSRPDRCGSGRRCWRGPGPVGLASHRRVRSRHPGDQRAHVGRPPVGGARPRHRRRRHRRDRLGVHPPTDGCARARGLNRFGSWAMMRGPCRHDAASPVRSPRSRCWAAARRARPVASTLRAVPRPARAAP